jgi:hypothetical protein
MVWRTLSFGTVFLLSVVTAAATWMKTLLPSLTKRALESVSTGQPSQYEWITPSIWFNQHLNPGTALLLLAALLMIVFIMVKGKAEQKTAIVSRLDQPLTYILLSFLPFLTIGTFTLFGYDYGRFARDQITFIGLIVAVLLGLAVANYKLANIRAWIVAIAVVMIIYPTPIHYWLSDHTGLRPCDEQAIEYLNQESKEPIVVQTFAKLAPWMYDLYTNQNVMYERAYNLSQTQSADYLLYRNNHMTHYTEHVSKPDDIEITPELLDSQSSLIEEAKFMSDDDVVILYRVQGVPAE